MHITMLTSLAEREEFLDEEDSEDEDSDVEDFTIPVSRKRKLTSDDKKAKKPRLQNDSKKICSQAMCTGSSRSTSGPTSEATTA